MISEAFSIFDGKVQSFSPPFLAANRGAAIRMVQDTMRGGESMLSRHPQDFTLYLIGTFDDQTGLVSAQPAFPLGVLSQFLVEPEAPPLLKAMQGGRD